MCLRVLDGAGAESLEGDASSSACRDDARGRPRCYLRCRQRFEGGCGRSEHQRSTRLTAVLQPLDVLGSASMAQIDALSRAIAMLEAQERRLEFSEGKRSSVNDLIAALRDYRCKVLK